MKTTKVKVFMVAVALLSILLFFNFTVDDEANAASKPTYKITPSTKPIDKKMLKYSSYNKKTHHYYTLRSYLEKLEKTKGGTLILNKGTYTITNVLYVPSNVTIQLENGVKIVKGTNTGTKKFNASNSIFQLIRPSKSTKSGVYGKYNGEKNIKFIGKGNAIIDLNYVKSSFAIIMGHNQNVEVNNIKFTNMNGGHFIEMDASKNVKILNSTFIGSKPSGAKKEAINLDTPDKTTNGWSQKWSKYDATPNDTVLIQNSVFDTLDRAIGTHKYSHKKLHNNVVIKNNKISNTRSDAIRVMNWSNATIENNIFSLNKAPNDMNLRGILVSGASNPTFQNNTFKNYPRAMQFIVWKNSGGGSEIPIFNTLSEDNKKALANNTVINAKENYIRITNKAYNDFSNAEKIDLIVSN